MDDHPGILGKARRLCLWLLGPLVCLAMIAYGYTGGRLSLSHHSYFVAFSFTGEIHGRFKVYAELDDGFFESPVHIAMGTGNKTIYAARLPARTIRSLRLELGRGPGAGTIEELRIVSLDDECASSLSRNPLL